MGPQGFGGSGENGYLFSGIWGALVIIFRDLGSKLIGKPSFCLIFSKISSASGIYKCIYFRANMLIWIGIHD